jgi:hypothetical protein
MVVVYFKDRIIEDFDDDAIRDHMKFRLLIHLIGGDDVR